ncbi:uncharacterized protein N7482_004661 [Penicillium canariense]|uniref:Uncharacterized protein n=1 Tax=Penicillium canariense TaxID=189055 RepID=A0A9W9ICU5_9EURO|nr:uncharacterized protein N7482_004661 [Penicillium canariense]KAJ5169067.1 hypothetical protein N7482_004661 [Penicillium canariense]
MPASQRTTSRRPSRRPSYAQSTASFEGKRRRSNASIQTGRGGGSGEAGIIRSRPQEDTSRHNSISSIDRLSVAPRREPRRSVPVDHIEPPRSNPVELAGNTPVEVPRSHPVDITEPPRRDSAVQSGVSPFEAPQRKPVKKNVSQPEPNTYQPLNLRVPADAKPKPDRRSFIGLESLQERKGKLPLGYPDVPEKR